MASMELSQTMRKRRLRSMVAGYLLILPALALVAFIILYPASRGIIQTLTTRPDGTATSFTLENYQSFFSDPFSLTNLLYTLRVTLTVVAVLFLISFPICLYLRFSKSRI